VHKELKPRTLETALDDGRLPPHACDGIPEFMMEMRQVNTTHMVPLHAFELLPDALVGVQLRGVGRQALQVPPRRRAVGQEFLDGVAAVDRRAIPKEPVRPGTARSRCSRKATTSPASMAWPWPWTDSFPAGEIARIAERGSRVDHPRRMGGCPIGASVRTMLGGIKPRCIYEEDRLLRRFGPVNRRAIRHTGRRQSCPGIVGNAAQGSAIMPSRWSPSNGFRILLANRIQSDGREERYGWEENRSHGSA